jgi:hypothetical protein
MVFIMALDPEEVVTLTDHGTMTLRSAVARAMMLPAQERAHASIVRDGDPAVLDFHLIRHIARRWDGQPHCLSDSDMAAGAFYLRQAGMALAVRNEATALPGLADSGRFPDPVSPPDWQGCGGAPGFRQASGLLMRGNASCHSP